MVDKHNNDVPPTVYQQRLSLPEREGWYTFGRIPYKIYYAFGCTGEDDMLSTRCPGRAEVTPDRGSEDTSLQILIHESVPVLYEDIVMYHELVESELMFGDKWPCSDAHKKATEKTLIYAKANL